MKALFAGSDYLLDDRGWPQRWLDREQLRAQGPNSPRTCHAGPTEAAEVALNTTANQGAGLTAGPFSLNHVVAFCHTVTYKQGAYKVIFRTHG